MAKFKQVPQTFLFKNIMRFWGNMVKNYDGDIRDDDFFDIVRNCFNHEEAIDLIKAAFTPDELEEMGKVSNRNARVDLSDHLGEIFQALWNNVQYRDRVKIILETIKDFMILNGEKSDDNEQIGKRFAALTHGLKLNELESDIALLSYIKHQTCFEWPCRVEDHEKSLYYAMALDRSYGEVLKVMTAKGRLRRFGVLDNDWDFNARTFDGFISGCEDEAIERRFYKKGDGKDVLPWEFYGELAEKDGKIIRSMISSGGKKNILLYGAPGTGKTSFARTLAKELGLTSFEIKQGDDNGKNMTSESRMVGIQICNEQEDPKKSMMIIDEADELLRDGSGSFSLFGTFFGGGRSTEKGITNTILDEMKMPAIWISNAPASAMDESVRRRFDYSVCFERMNSVQRMSIWRNLVRKHGLGDILAEEKIADLAAKYETSAGGISVVLENAKKMGMTAKNADALIASLMKPHCKLMEVKESGRFLPAKGYSLEGLNIQGKVKLDKIVKAVRNYLDAGFNESSEDKPRMNILMYGAPGTGKTEFVKYLGKTLDRKVLVKKASDLLDMYVGNTEKRIAAAFRQAEAEHAILFFDEIDGLVQNREGASQSWQVTQVNELLQQMENFDGVMIAATNFCKNLDPTIMRRFTFKLSFDYLEDEGKRIFFERFFNAKLTEGEFKRLKEIQNLAPGDFRTVRQERFYLDEPQTNLQLIEALVEECSLKKDGSSVSKIGF